jgi:hypothetical protein
VSVIVKGNKLSTEGLRVEVPRQNAPFIIELGPSTGVSGTYEQTSELLRFRQLRASELQFNVLELHLPKAEVRIDTPSLIQKLLVDGDIALDGRAASTCSLSVGRASLEQLFLRSETARCSAGLHLEELTCEQMERQAKNIRLKKAQLNNLKLEFAGATLDVGRVVLDNAELSIGPRGAPFVLQCAKAEAGAITLSTAQGSYELDGVHFPAGLKFEEGTLSCPRLDVALLSVALRALPKAAARKQGMARSIDSSAMPDLPFLDKLQGRLHADVTVDVSLPIIKSRRATHSLRLSIEEGAINFKQLERSLAGLEDAVLDFEVTDDALIFERDIVPGVTFDNQTLVSWPLDGPDHALAKREQRIRLRKLLDYRLSPALLGTRSAKPAKEKSSVELRQLQVDNVDVELELGGLSELGIADGVTLRLGSDGVAAVGRLKLRGALHYSPGERRDTTELHLEVERVLAGVVIEKLFGHRVELGALELARLDKARVRFEGFQPRDASATAHAIRLSQLTLHGLHRSG